MNEGSILLAVPNISEGRDEGLIRTIAGDDALLDIHSDPDHNRSVLTYGGDPDVVLEAVVAMVDRVVGALDLADHRGAHPRFGVVDVLPFIPYAAPEQDALRVAHEAVWRIAQGPGVPVHTYDRLAPDHRTLPALRRELRRDPSVAHPTAGSICIGVRDPLIAFNVNVRGPLAAAREACKALRALPGLRALAFELPTQQLVQLSMNLVDLRVITPGPAYRSATAEATARGLTVVDAEVVGLVPHRVLAELGEIPLRRPVRSVEEAIGMTRGLDG